MKPGQFPQVPTKTEFFPFQGGLNTATPALRVPAGSLIACLNYEPSAMGGYNRAGNYERFSGRPRPSDALYQQVACTLTLTPPTGIGVTIGSATGLFVQATSDGCLLTGVVGTIPGSTPIITSGSLTIGATSANPTSLVSTTALLDATFLVAAGDVWRNFITAPSGSGPVRGVYRYNGSTWCFRDNAGGTAGQLFKSTATGWALQALGEEIAFTNANTALRDLAILTQGGVSATVSRVVLETGTLLSGVNTGRLMLRSRVGGSFSAGAATSTAGGTLTLSGVQTTTILTTGGVYQFDTYNFAGQLSSARMYFCNGVGRACEWDGETLVPIQGSAPSYIKGHRKYLVLGVGSSILISSVGNPYRFVSSEGAMEDAVGDVVTGLATMPGQALGIFCRNSSLVLLGASSSSWSQQPIRADVGAVAYTVQSMSDTYSLDDRGFIGYRAVQEYGNFADATLSRHIQPLVDAARNRVVASYVARQKGHYNLLLNDGSTITMGINAAQLTGFTTGQLGFTPSCACSMEDESGVERVFIGGTDGQVYEYNRGSTQDGADLEAFLKVYYINSKTPEVRKFYRKLVLEMSSTLYSQISFQAEFSYGDPLIEQSAASSVSVKPSGGSYDVERYDTFFYDSQEVYSPSLSMVGTGLNVALSFYSRSKLDFGHVLSGAVVKYSPRRLEH